MLTFIEFKAAVITMGLRDALYFARILGTSMAQCQLWIRAK